MCSHEGSASRAVCSLPINDGSWADIHSSALHMPLGGRLLGTCQHTHSRLNFHIHIYVSKIPKVEQKPIVPKKHSVFLLLLLPLFASAAFALCLLFHCSLQTSIRVKVEVCMLPRVHAAHRSHFQAGDYQQR